MHIPGAMAESPTPPGHERSQSAASLSRFYHGQNGEAHEDDLTDPSLDFCNAFWGPGDRGYEVIMTRLRSAAKTVDDLKAFWKERASIEEDYAKRLSKLAKMPLGNNEIGDLHHALQTVQMETAAQASYHLQMSSEIHTAVEQPTAEFGNRLATLKKGPQASIEKSWRSKGLQEAHVAKARDRYEKDCLKLNSYTANMQLVQGRERDELESKMDKVRRSIQSEEQDFRNFVRVLEETSAKWETEWRGFCDVVQDLEEDRLSMTKDVVWAYANAVSQVCVEDDSSCERVREKLEQFEPPNDMVFFVKGWGTGGRIPDPPRFINYGLGDAPAPPGFHHAQFRRQSDRPPLQPVPRQVPESEPQSAVSGAPTSAAPSSAIETAVKSPAPAPATAPMPEELNAPRSGNQGQYSPELPPVPPTKEDKFTPPTVRSYQLTDNPTPSSAPAKDTGYRPPFGMPLPGMAAVGGAAAGIGAVTGAAAFSRSNDTVSPAPFSVDSAKSGGPPSPSARDVQDQEDPMARALAELRHNPPGPNNVRRAPSQRRAESTYSVTGRPGSGVAGSSVSQHRAPSPAPSNHGRQQSYQAPAGSAQGGMGSSGLIPPREGHTAAQLAKSMAEFENRSINRQSVNYNNYADDVVGAHPTSRPTSPAPNRAPSPAFMQPPTQPATHIADDVLPRYGQAFPGERSRSRPASVYSSHSRANSVVGVPPPGQQEDAVPREAFAGIGAGNAARSPSPRPHSFRSPSPGPGANPHSALGPPNLGIALDASGSVAQDSMAEQYRQRYQQSQRLSQQPQQQPQQQQQQRQTSLEQQQWGQVPSFGAPQTQSPPPDKSYPPRMSGSFGHVAPSQSTGSISQQAYAGLPQQQQPQPQQSPEPQYELQPLGTAPPLRAEQLYGQRQSQSQYDQYAQQPPTQPAPQTMQQQPQYNQYGQQPVQQQQTAQQQSPYPQHSYSGSNASYMGSYGGRQQQQQQPRQASQQQNGYDGGYRVPSPQPQPQQYRAPSPQPQQYRAPSPQPQAQLQQQPQQQMYRTPSPQPAYHQQSQQSQQPQQIQQPQQARGTPSPIPAQPPSNPAPTGQWATDGRPILFYVRAVYGYQAQSPVEFDFQADDIIAVTSTPEDGWWSGELLDESRRMPGRTDFPSNFVELF
ncbi:hypothetical protein CC85DRAFT_306682 [Cutaneotrichosporon oleaginosum]|uniref:SH3 domain-containing protein n=1 Tax=Cutaneotrichosporon oleaginosum TaxID=879819 RepID=A0A0J0XWS2_9TREE|nr:uncharacterized protein CC85DRAFT_306682 [Cutaneotrichosporon oleaginosum]KLT45498.1 hypothetical protein CC85DRAFT_306682 [Cutaneotrichosporon oleaginosum]